MEMDIKNGHLNYCVEMAERALTGTERQQITGYALIFNGCVDSWDTGFVAHFDTIEDLQNFNKALEKILSPKE